MLPLHILQSLYYSSVHCHLNFGILAWGHATSAGRIHKLQKRAIRLVCNKPYRYHTDPLFRTLNILKLNDLYKLNVCLFMFDYKYQRLPMSFNNYFVKKTHSIRTRAAGTYFREQPRTKFSSLLPKHNFLKLWNATLPEFHATEKRNTLKVSFKKQAIESYLEVVHCENTRCQQCYHI